jgi:hypothetical protein
MAAEQDITRLCDALKWDKSHNKKTAPYCGAVLFKTKQLIKPMKSF